MAILISCNVIGFIGCMEENVFWPFILFPIPCDISIFFLGPCFFDFMITGSLMAYCGPNSLLLGSIRFGGWNFSEITDLGGNIFWISVLFLVDFGSTLLSFILLKIFGGMNIFKMYYQVVQEMGVVLAIQQGYIVVEVSKNSSHNTSCIPVP